MSTRQQEPAFAAEEIARIFSRLKLPMRLETRKA